MNRKSQLVSSFKKTQNPDSYTGCDNLEKNLMNISNVFNVGTHSVQPPTVSYQPYVNTTTDQPDNPNNTVQLSLLTINLTYNKFNIVLNKVTLPGTISNFILLIRKHRL
jgi:hypothetical protein